MSAGSDLKTVCFQINHQEREREKEKKFSLWKEDLSVFWISVVTAVMRKLKGNCVAEWTCRRPDNSSLVILLIHYF